MARTLVPSRPGIISRVSLRVACHVVHPVTRICTSSVSQNLLRNQQRLAGISEAHFSWKSWSPWIRRGGSIYEINKVCQFSGRGPTPGLCPWLTLGLWGIRSFCARTLVVILLQWESPGAFYLLIQLFGSLLDCPSDAVKPM